VQSISFLGMELDSVSMTARLTNECVQLVLNCLNTFRRKSAVPLKQYTGRIALRASASSTGWGAVCNRHAALGSWTGSRLHWHTNCQELLSVLFALHRFQPLLQGKLVLVYTDKTATVAYINLQGGVLACHNPPTISSSGVSSGS